MGSFTYTREAILRGPEGLRNIAERVSKKTLVSVLLVSCILGTSDSCYATGLPRVVLSAFFTMMEEDDVNFRSPKKKRRCTRQVEGRFPTMSEEEMPEISRVFVPSNTTKNTEWAVSCFHEWRSARNCVKDSGQKHDLLENPVVEDLNYWLARFVAEVRNQQGKPYTPQSIHQIVCGLQRYMLNINPTAPILNKDEPNFLEFRSAIDCVFR